MRPSVTAVLACAALVAAVLPAAAQTPTPAGRTVRFLPRMLFQLGAEHLSGEDRRFIWDADFGAELDLVDYGVGRGTFVANYEVVLGDELREFDPNQGNYIFEGLASARLRGVEIAGIFYHQSRHLADRPKEDPIDWNMLGVRLLGDRPVGGGRLALRADLRRTIKKSFVDYQWELDGRARADVPVAGRVGVMAAGAVRVLGVDGSRERGTQTGYRGEGGIRLEGDAGAVELFVAAERRVDPYPMAFGTVRWITAGFRLLTR